MDSASPKLNQNLNIGPNSIILANKLFSVTANKLFSVTAGADLDPIISLAYNII